jgi:sulfite reductase alpha subunit-like flavoprotein
MEAAIIYWSKTGNTEKVALAINEALEAAGVEVLFKRTEEAADINFYDYDEPRDRETITRGSVAGAGRATGPPTVT